MTQEKWQDTFVSIKHKIFTARNAKIAAAVIVIAVIAGAGGRYYLTSGTSPATKSKSLPWPI